MTTVLVLVPAKLAAQADLEPEAVVDAFHAALSAGDSAAALGFLAPDVVIFESGGAEMSREEYRSHHLGADIEFSESTAQAITNRRVETGEGIAVVLTRSATRGTFRDRDVDSQGVETMILGHNEEGWKISHIHWSSKRSPPSGSSK